MRHRVTPGKPTIANRCIGYGKKPAGALLCPAGEPNVRYWPRADVNQRVSFRPIADL